MSSVAFDWLLELHLGKKVGLRTEILLTLTLLMGASLLFGGIMLLRLTEKSLLEQRISQLDVLSKTVVLALVQTLGERASFISGADADLLRRLPPDVNSEGWWLYDRDLRLLSAQETNATKQLPESRRQQVRLTKETFHELKFPTLLGLFGLEDTSSHYLLPLIKENRFIGLLEMHFSLADIRYRLLYSQKMIFLYVLLYGAVLVLIGYYLLQRNVISPASKLLRATEEVSRGELDRRLQPDGPLEIARLAEAYNRMVEALKSSQQETRDQITALEATNRDLNRTREELIQSEKMSSVGQLAAGLAHELGNPLSALIGYLSLLRERVENADDGEIVVRSLVEAERIDFLVRELLDFSRPDAVDIEILDPVLELRRCVELLQNQGTLSGLVVQDDLPRDNKSAVSINSRKLQQVYVNLLLNAVHACSAAGTIRLSVDLSATSLAVRIEDNGCGIAASELSRIFDPFYTSKEPGEGTGLGLAVCHRIVEEAGGRISANSRLGKGSIFKVEFPVSTV